MRPPPPPASSGAGADALACLSAVRPCSKARRGRCALKDPFSLAVHMPHHRLGLDAAGLRASCLGSEQAEARRQGALASVKQTPGLQLLSMQVMSKEFIRLACTRRCAAVWTRKT